MDKIDDRKLMRLIEKIKYSFREKDPIELRRVGCVDERAVDFPAGRMAGGDIGQEIVILSAANSIGQSLDVRVVFNLLAKFVNGEKNLHRHENCGYQEVLSLYPEEFGVTREQTEAAIERFLASKAEHPVLEGSHNAVAFTIVESDSFALSSSHPDEEDRVFVHHKTLIEDRQEKLAKELIDKGIIKLPEGMSRQDFAELLKKIVIEHLNTTKTLLKLDGVPTREVKIDNKGRVNIK
jgi:hypothetical protein